MRVRFGVSTPIRTQPISMIKNKGITIYARACVRACVCEEGNFGGGLCLGGILSTGGLCP